MFVKQGYIIIIGIFINSLVSAQLNDKTVICAGLSSGISKTTSYSSLLNYYTYKGYAFPVVVDFSCKWKQSYFMLSLSGQHGTMYSDNINKSLYEYNHVKHYFGALNMNYLRQIFSHKSNFQSYLGVSSHLHYIIQDEYYSSYLYENAYGHRKAYDLSILSIAPDLIFNYHSNKNTCSLELSYIPFTISVKPEDIAVKQLNFMKNAHTTRFYFIDEYTGLHAFFSYNRKINEFISVTTGFAMESFQYRGIDKFLFAHGKFIVGIKKKFK